jgi:hypothetical protein
VTTEILLPEEPEPTEAPEPTAAPDVDAAWETLLGRLNRLSVTRHFDAYGDVDWDAPELALDPCDPRFELDEADPLGTTPWYRSQPPEVRARLGCELVAAKMKTGLLFENVLERGLLEYASTLPNRSAEFRYAYHEVIEESHHSLMFQEFVNRSGSDPEGLGRLERAAARRIVGLARRFPALFFVFVLGGEDPIDHVQREVLRRAPEGRLHPLLERIMRIHVTEEARHLSFARHWLRRQVPTLGPARRIALMIGTPLVLAGMAHLMLLPPRRLVRTYRIPRAVLKDAYLRNPAYRAEVAASLRKVRSLADELGLRPAPVRSLWRILGLEEPGRVQDRLAPSR